MPFIDGTVLAVPAANKQAYIAHARQAAELFKEWGASRVVENWADEVPKGKVTDFYRAVAANPDEVIVFSWIEYPDKATRDSVMEKMRSDPRMMDMKMPFDGSRMIYGSFETLFAV